MRKLLLPKKIGVFLILLAVLLVGVGNVEGATITTLGSGNWNSTTPGLPWPGGTVPASTDNVIIAAGHTITVSAAASITDLNLNATTSKLVINSGQTLTVSGTFVNSGTTTNGVNGPGTIIFTGTSSFGSLTPTGTLPSVQIGDGTSANTVTIGANTVVADITVSTNATLTLGAFSFTVNGSSYVSGSLNITSATGTKTFIGLITVNSGGVWNNSFANEAVTIRGGITNNGTFTAGTGVYTFSTSNQTISGTLTIPSVTVTGITLTNDGIFTVTTALVGTGGLTNSATAQLHINFTGAVSITTLTATAPGNLVDYGFAGTQTVKATTYNNLTLSGSGTKTISSITIGNGGSITSSNLALVFTGDFVNNGTAFNAGSSAITFSGTNNQSIDRFTTTGGITISKTSGTVALNGTSSAASLTFTASGATISINNSLAITNAITLNNATAANVTAVITGTGSLSCASVSIGNNTAATGNNSSFTHTLTSSIASLNVSGNLNINSYFANTNRVRNGVFSHSSGSVTVDGSIVTSNANAANTSIYILGSSSPTLNLGGATPFTLSATGTSNTTLNGTGATVNYDGSGAQPVRTTPYTNLTLSGGNTKTFSGITSISGNLSIASGTIANLGTFTSSANSMDIGGEGVINGSWGSTTSPATYKNNNYFAATTGIVNVSTSSCSAPVAPTSGGDQTICSGQSIPSLTVTVGVGQTADWYTASSGGTLLLAGNTSYTPTGAGTYYAQARNTTTGCISVSRTAVALIVNNPPSISSTSPGSRCGTGTVVISATASSGTLNWYDAPSGGNYLGTGSPFTTPSISSTTTFYVDATDGSCTTATRTPVLASIIPSPSITAGGGGSFCTGTNLTLTSTGTNITNQYWTGPNSFYSLDQNPVISNITTAMSGTYIVTGSSLSGANLVTNGNFSSGNTGFTTAYALAAQTSSGLNPEGAYDVVALPSSRHSNFCSCGDHTSGSGLQMVINGAGTESVIWSQTVNVVPNTAYQFTYWVQTVVNGNDPNPSKIQLFVNGSNAGIVYTANATTGVWTQFTYNWTSGSGITTAILDLKNENFASGGNDFALDDIEFYQVCEATSSVNVTVDPTSVGGAVNGGTTVCSGSASGLLTLSGHTGTITKWQYSVDNWVTPVDIANTSTTYTSGALTQTTQFRAVVTSGVCSSANSAATTVTVEPAIANSTISANQTFCTSGDPAQLNGSVPTGGSGTFSYQWQSSPDNTTWTNIGSATAQNYDPSAIASTTYYRRGVSSGSCPMVYSASVQILIEPNLPASVSVVASSTTICAGTSVTFTATPTNGGTGPTYQWKLNGSNVGSGGTTYTNVSLANGDVVTCIMTSNATPCLTGSPATSNAVSMTVNPNLPASVSIGATATTICDGTSVTFTATPTNGGAAPTYQWKLNGVNVGSGGTTYTNASLVNGDVVTCIMTSNATPCLTGSPATSNAVSMTVNPNLTPTVTIAASPVGAICAGTSVTFTATAGNAGGGTVSYNFKVDGTSQQNGASNTFASTTLTNGNAVTCEITVTGGTCLTTNTATSNTITMIVNSLTGTPTFTSGATSICQDANDETYTATAANSISIAYSVLPVEAGLINASTGVMNWSASFFGTATITATANGLCGTTSADQIVTINPLPTPGPIIPD